MQYIQLTMVKIKIKRKMFQTRKLLFSLDILFCFVLKRKKITKRICRSLLIVDVMTMLLVLHLDWYRTTPTSICKYRQILVVTGLNFHQNKNYTAQYTSISVHNYRQLFELQSLLIEIGQHQQIMIRCICQTI